MPVPPLAARILRRHRASLAGTLCYRRLPSRALGLAKPYYVYEPPGVALARGLPVCYLFRGHEREWAYLREDGSRRLRTAVEEVDRLVAAGRLPPLLLVLPGLNSDDNHVPSLGVDMAGSWPAARKGLGTGRFWQYLTDELFPHVERRYQGVAGGPHLMAGFSLGGFTVSLLGVLRPGLFDHAAVYDGLFTWPGHRDPRYPAPRQAVLEAANGAARTARLRPAAARLARTALAAVSGRGSDGCTDPVWCGAPIFDAALGRPRDAGAMRRWNPTDALAALSPAARKELRRTTFWIRCAAADGSRGNLDRTRFFTARLREAGVPLGFDGDVVLHPRAAHTWHWTDRFLARFLLRALVE